MACSRCGGISVTREPRPPSVTSRPGTVAPIPGRKTAKDSTTRVKYVPTRGGK